MYKLYIKNKRTSDVFEFLPNKLVLTHDKHYTEFYVARPTIFGNPYSHLTETSAKFKVKTREEAVKNYVKFYLPTIFLQIKNIEYEFEKCNICLTCHCVPFYCHAIEIAKVIIQHHEKAIQISFS